MLILAARRVAGPAVGLGRHGVAGPGAFFAIGAAVVAAVVSWWPADLFVALVVASGVGAAAARVGGHPDVAARSLYLAVSTFALALATTSSMLNETSSWVRAAHQADAFLGGLSECRANAVYSLALASWSRDGRRLLGIRRASSARRSALRDIGRAAQATAT